MSQIDLTVPVGALTEEGAASIQRDLARALLTWGGRTRLGDIPFPAVVLPACAACRGAGHRSRRRPRFRVNVTVPFGILDDERRPGIEDLRRRIVHVSLFQARVVGHGHASQLGQLLTAQAGHPPVAAVVDKPHVTGFESGAAAAKEFAQLGTALLDHAGVHSGIGLLDHGVQYEQAWSALPVPVSVGKRFVRSGADPAAVTPMQPHAPGLYSSAACRSSSGFRPAGAVGKSSRLRCAASCARTGTRARQG
ncbi:hypothetical protein SAFG77S_13461 [Streptomyces afghaniensis]